MSWYPSAQEQLYPPIVLRHNSVQLSVRRSHSSMSEEIGNSGESLTLTPNGILQHRMMKSYKVRQVFTVVHQHIRQYISKQIHTFTWSPILSQCVPISTTTCESSFSIGTHLRTVVHVQQTLVDIYVHTSTTTITDMITLSYTSHTNLYNLYRLLPVQIHLYSNIGRTQQSCYKVENSCVGEWHTRWYLRIQKFIQ